jgi:YbbR domain-containing protein
MKRLHDLIFNDFWLKFFSFILACLIWFTIRFGLDHGFSLSPGTIRSMEHREIGPIPITLLKDANDPRTFKISPSQTMVTITGPTTKLEEITSRQIQAFVNLADKEEDSVLVKRVEVFTPSGISVMHIEPSLVRIKVINESTNK